MILLLPLEAIATIARLTHFVQTLNSQVDTPLEKLTGQLNLALDAIVVYVYTVDCKTVYYSNSSRDLFM